MVNGNEEKKADTQKEWGSHNLFVARQLFHFSPQIESLVKANICGSRSLRVLKNAQGHNFIFLSRHYFILRENELV